MNVYKVVYQRDDYAEGATEVKHALADSANEALNKFSDYTYKQNFTAQVLSVEVVISGVIK